MEAFSNDPVDHSRTTRQHAGETMKNGANVPGLVSLAFAVVSLVIGLAALANGSAAGWVAFGAAAVLGIGGAAWLYAAHRRVRSHEVQLAKRSPTTDAPPPTS